jgi:virginiamycin B lyase
MLTKATIQREFTGKISEWPVPTPAFARDPVFDPEGRIYFAVRDGDKIARFDTVTKSFKEWALPVGMRPLSPVVTRDGKLVFGGGGNNAIGELDPNTGKVKTYPIPSQGAYPYTLAIDAADNIWFVERKLGQIAKLDRSSGMITEYPVGASPYALLVDAAGSVWVSRMDADSITKFNPKTGQISNVFMGVGAMPRRLCIAPDGSLWVTLYGLGRLARVDTASLKILKEYDLPGGPNAGPYAINADSRGRIWVSEIQTDSLVVLSPATSLMQVIKLPSKNTGVRNAVVSPKGSYWYIGSHVGKIGVVE